MGKSWLLLPSPAVEVLLACLLLVLLGVCLDRWRLTGEAKGNPWDAGDSRWRLRFFEHVAARNPGLGAVFFFFFPAEFPSLRSTYCFDPNGGSWGSSEGTSILSKTDGVVGSSSFSMFRLVEAVTIIPAAVSAIRSSFSPSMILYLRAALSRGSATSVYWWVTSRSSAITSSVVGICGGWGKSQIARFLSSGWRVVGSLDEDLLGGGLVSSLSFLWSSGYDMDFSLHCKLACRSLGWDKSLMCALIGTSPSALEYANIITV